MEILPSIIVMDDAVNDRLCHSRITLSPNSAIPVSWFKLSAEDDSEGHKLGIASNHGDVLHWFPKHGKSMDDFRADVKAKLADCAEPRKFFRVILGSYLERSNAEAVLEKARSAGFKDVFLKYE